MRLLQFFGLLYFALIGFYPTPSQADNTVTITRDLSCPAGYQRRGGRCVSMFGYMDFAGTVARYLADSGNIAFNFEPFAVDTSYTVGQCDAENPTSDHPVILSSGVKRLVESDFVAEGLHPIEVTREYRSNLANIGMFGPNWSSSFDYRLNFLYQGVVCKPEPGVTGGCDGLTVLTGMQLVRPGGATFPLTWDGQRSAWVDSKPDSIAYLEEQTNGTWVFYGEDKFTEVYNSDGFILSRKDENNIGLTFQYNSGNRLNKILHSNGRQVSFTWAGNKVNTMTDTAGNSFNYTYNSYGYLASVTFPGYPTTTRTYHYENSGARHQVTGISINNVRYSNYVYDSNGRVTESGLANGVEKSTFSYQFSQNGSRTTQTNALGQDIEYGYTSAGGVAKLYNVINRATNTCPLTSAYRTYDDNGFLQSSTDFEGNSNRFTYNDKGQITEAKLGMQASGPSKRLVYSWNSTLELLESEKVYDIDDNLIKETEFNYFNNGLAKNKLQSVVITNHSGVGQITSKTYQYSYTFSNGILSSKTINGPATDINDSFTYKYDSFGNLTENLLSNGLKVTYSNYNGLGLAGRVTEPNGSYKDYTYDERGRVKSVSKLVNGQPSTIYYYYNNFGKVYRINYYGERAVNFTYDNIGRVTKRTQFENSIDPHQWEESETIYTYDLLSNLVKKEEKRVLTREVYQWGEWIPRVSRTTHFSQSFQYDSLGRVIRKSGNNGQFVEYEYDGNNRIIQIVDALGRATSYTYDSLGNLKTSTDPNNGVVAYEYDVFNQLKAVVDTRGNRTEYTRDPFGYSYADSSPDSGSTSLQLLSDGRPVQLTKSDGKVINYSYDSIGRVVGVNSSSESQTFTYDTCVNGQAKLCSFTDESGTTSYDYTTWGAINSHTQIINGMSFAINYIYDSKGRLEDILYPNGVKVRYEYNFNTGNIQAIKVLIGGTWRYIVSDIKHQPNGPVSSWSFGNGLSRIQNYDSDWRLTELSTAGIQKLTYQYSIGDDIKKIINGENSINTQSYSYDNLRRLKSVISASGDQSFNYDENNNRTNHTYQGTTTSYTISNNSNKLNTANKLGLNRSFNYDMNGNVSVMTGADGSTLTLTYNDFEQLNKITRNATTTNYKINANGFRVYKSGTSGSYRFLYDSSGKLLAETNNNSSSLNTIYIYLKGELVGLVRNSNVYFVHNDHIGRPEVVTDLSKSIVWRSSNLAFSRVVDYSTFGELNIGFPGQYYDIESGLWNNRHRVYDESIGRYLQSDPIGLAGGLNSYGYVNQNPLSYIDPNGLDGGAIIGIYTNPNYDSPTPNPGEGAIMLATASINAHGAQFDLASNYIIMRKLKWRESDKYFHCKANCQAGQRGIGGSFTSCLISDAREVADVILKGDDEASVLADQFANYTGRAGGANNPESSCSEICSQFRPASLPDGY